MSRGHPSRLIPKIAATGALDSDTLAKHLRTIINRGTASFLPGRRWFGDKSRQIERTEVFDLAVVSAGPDYFAPTLVKVEFEDGGAASYFLPLVVTLEALPADATLGVIERAADRWRVVEALSILRFQEWLLARLAAPAMVPMRAGTLTFEPTSVLSNYLAAAQTGGSRVVTGEQSNTSIVYGDAAILKAFRKLQPGVNPDIEIGAYLTEQTRFRHVPPLLGSMRYEPGHGEAVSIGVLQTFVPSTGDGWTMTIKELTALASLKPDHPDRDAAFAKMIRWAAILGRRTGELHVALAADNGGDAFRPEPVTSEDVKSWKVALLHAGNDRRSDLDRLLETWTDSTVIDIARRQLGEPVIDSVSAGFEALEGTSRIRVHGDYHLGQILRTVDGDVMILDFEGEPSRPISERRLKTSALKDVAGMLRSFSYVRVAVRKALGGTVLESAERILAEWEASARKAFLDEYQTATRHAAVPLIPAADRAFGQALRAWEVDKALYEVAYEMNNRPDWLGQVLQTLAEPPSSGN